jgi:hypothetical protein
LKEAAHAVFEVNDEIALVQLAEIDLGAVPAELFRALEPPPAVGGVAAKQLGAGKNDELAIGENESARKRSFEQIDSGNGVAHDFAEPLDLPFGLEINDDPKFRRAPIAKPGRELGALRFDEHEIAHRKIADIAGVEGAGDAIAS